MCMVSKIYSRSVSAVYLLLMSSKLVVCKEREAVENGSLVSAVTKPIFPRKIDEPNNNVGSFCTGFETGL